MDYAIKLNAVNNTETKVKAFAAVTLGGCFKITNVAVVEGKEGRLFVSMPSFKGRDTEGRTAYKDVCNSITRQFREELYGEILGLYEEYGAGRKNGGHKSGGRERRTGIFSQRHAL